jgi:anaerobic magnesium-protoporphyrin IX monomethyl ester cyclase
MKQKANVLLIQPHSRNYGFGENWKPLGAVITPSIGLMYLSAPLMKNGFRVSLLDFNIEGPKKEEFNKIIKKQDFVLVTCYTKYMEKVRKLLSDIRVANDRAIIICGGPHCIMEKKFVYGSDITVVGEAENFIVPLLESILKKRSLKAFPGLIYNEGGKIIKNPGIMQVHDLDSSCFPSTELIKDKHYTRDLLGFEMIPFISSRGCPFRCKYCSFSTFGYRERSVDNVISEIKTIVKQGFRYLVFYDDNFLTNKKRAMEIMDRIINEGIKIKMIIQGRVDSADEELFRKLKKAGVGMLIVGIENGNQEVLDFYNKCTTVDKLRNALTLANKAGILTVGFIIIGAPMETKDHFERTFKFLNDIKLDFTSIDVLRYSRGTELWEDAVKKGLIQEDQNLVLANKKLSHYSTNELMKIRHDMVNRFYKNPRRLFRIIYKILRTRDLRLIAGILKLFFMNFRAVLITTGAQVKK